MKGFVFSLVTTHHTNDPAHRPLLSRWAVVVVLLCSLCSGCSTIISAFSPDPIQRNPGKRTFGAVIDDEQIETISYVNLDKGSEALADAHISVTSYNGVVLLTGQVSSKDLRREASQIISDITKVRQVHNELQVQGTTSFLARTNDTWLTTKVKTRLLANEDINGRRIKVVTESGVVYLMGLLSRVEAEQAAEVVRTTGGVQKVVTAIEYID